VAADRVSGTVTNIGSGIGTAIKDHEVMAHETHGLVMNIGKALLAVLAGAGWFTKWNIWKIKRRMSGEEDEEE
jgi:hypothetical protein